MKITPIATLAACMALSVAGQTGRIRVADLGADLTFRASDALEGRLSLERGSEAAIQFLAAGFAKAGLKPVNGESYLPPGPLVEYRVDRSETKFAYWRASERHAVTYGGDFFGGSSVESDVRGAVVFAGYGITAPKFGYDDYAGLDARGKIVLIFDH